MPFYLGDAPEAGEKTPEPPSLGVPGAGRDEKEQYPNDGQEVEGRTRMRNRWHRPPAAAPKRSSMGIAESGEPRKEKTI